MKSSNNPLKIAFILYPPSSLKNDALLLSYFPRSTFVNISQYSFNIFHNKLILPASSVGIGVPRRVNSSSQRRILSFILFII